MRMMSGRRRGLSGDTAAALRSIRAPTLLLVPELDLYNPVEDAIEAAALIPNAMLVRLGGNAGHAVAADTSPQVAEVRSGDRQIPDAVSRLSLTDAATAAALPALLDRRRRQGSLFERSSVGACKKKKYRRKPMTKLLSDKRGHELSRARLPLPGRCVERKRSRPNFAASSRTMRPQDRRPDQGRDAPSQPRALSPGSTR